MNYKNGLTRFNQITSCLGYSQEQLSLTTLAIVLDDKPRGDNGVPDVQCVAFS